MTTALKNAPLKMGGPAFLDGVIEKMMQLRADHGARMFAFTAPGHRTGTTHVVNLLAAELTVRYRLTVAVMPASTIQTTEPGDLSQGFVERSTGLYVAASNSELQGLSDGALEKVWISPNPEDFDFILADCPALLPTPQTLLWTSEASGTFLVVAAGMTHVNQIEEAQRLLRMSASSLEGIILNRRSYPIPELLYKLI